MKHVNLEDIQRVANVSAIPTRPLTREERLARWAELLDRHAGERLATLHGTEYEPPAQRATMRAVDSPISIAHADPVLRDDGLRGDSYGDAMRYFELSDWQLHDIVCHCHFGGTMPAETAARRVRAAIEGDKPTLLARMRTMFNG
jgi:hypothetical protein